MTTRRVLERVPNDQTGVETTQKSMSLGQLALHVATIPGNVAEIASVSPFQVPPFAQPAPRPRANSCRRSTRVSSKARTMLGGMDDAALAATWRLMHGDRELMAMPRGAVLRTIMLNHWYHHRGQLSVYLRALNVPLPSIYGPSADENPFARQRTVSAAS